MQMSVKLLTMRHCLVGAVALLSVYCVYMLAPAKASKSRTVGMAYASSGVLEHLLNRRLLRSSEPDVGPQVGGALEHIEDSIDGLLFDAKLTPLLNERATNWGFPMPFAAISTPWRSPSDLWLLRPGICFADCKLHTSFTTQI